MSQISSSNVKFKEKTRLIFVLFLAIYPALTEGSLAQFSFDGMPRQGVIRWIGYHDSRNELLAGLEMVVS